MRQKKNVVKAAYCLIDFHVDFHRSITSDFTCVQIFTPLQCARFFWRCYPCGPDLLSLMAAAAAAAKEPCAADIFLAAQCKSGGSEPSAEWRQVLVQPLSSLRCNT